MASFEVKAYKLNVEKHPDADLLEIATVGAYKSVVPKGVYETGDVAVYIPEQAVVPEPILAELNLTGRLAGKEKNRVSAIKLRGVLSQGLIYPNKGNWKEGDDVTDVLGVTKYEPEIPECLLGEVFNAGLEYTINYDIENYKKYPELIEEGELVQLTEKVHGTFFMVAGVPSSMQKENLINGRNAISSKGFAAKGLSFKDVEANENNIYLEVAKKFDLFDKANDFADKVGDVVVIAGEIFGAGVQDLSYGVLDEKDYRVFDVAVGESRVDKKFLGHKELDKFVSEYDLKRVPVLYVGEFNESILEEFTNGKETLSGKESHIREGVVIKPVVERYDQSFGRVFLKNVSEDYLLRKGGTEYN